MAKLRFIGDSPRTVVCNGHPRGGNLGTVEPDEILEVDDAVFLAHAWPESLWSEVEVPDRPEDKPAVEAQPVEKPTAKPPAEPSALGSGKSRPVSEKE